MYNLGNYVVLDIETDIYGHSASPGRSRASFVEPANSIVAVGAYCKTEPYGGYHCSFVDTYDKHGVSERRFLPRVVDVLKAKAPFVLVGHNIGFDLTWLLHRSDSEDVDKFWDLFKDGDNIIWDTAICEYLLSGQSNKFPSLDSLCVDYQQLDPRITLKDDKIKMYWDSGVTTSRIPKEDLEPYLRSDVINTAFVYEQQLIEVHKSGQIKLMIAAMNDRLATISMEREGLIIDESTLNDHYARLTAELEYLRARCLQYAGTLALKVFGETLPKEELECYTKFTKLAYSLIFHKDYTYKTRDVKRDEDGTIERYKNGKVKMHTVEKTLTTKVAELGASLTARLGRTPSGDYQVSADNMKIVKSSLLPWDDKYQLLNYSIKYKTVQKAINTYYKPYVDYIEETKYVRVHPVFQHTATATGRLSATSPNSTNLPNITIELETEAL